jgi:hypothetical protein
MHHFGLAITLDCIEIGVLGETERVKKAQRFQSTRQSIAWLGGIRCPTKGHNVSLLLVGRRR